jgi:DNA-binding NarL/FixJ family response regulator
MLKQVHRAVPLEQVAGFPARVLGERLDKKPVRILVVEDFEPFRRYLHSRLQEVIGMEVVGDTGDGIEAIRKAKQLQPDLTFIDVGISSISGIEAASQILNVSPHSKILFISQQSSPEIVDAALSIGDGYLLKSDSERELMNAIESVLQGRKFRSTSLGT